MTSIHRRQFIRYTTIGLASSVLLPQSMFGLSAGNGGNVMVETAYGKIKGLKVNAGNNLFNYILIGISFP